MSSRLVVALTLSQVVIALCGQAPAPNAAEIMKRLAANQDRADAARTHFVYEQHMHGTMRNRSGRLLLEEWRIYDVTPQSNKTDRKLRSAHGRYWHSKQLVSYEGEQSPDGDSIEMFEDSEGSRDGLGHRLFPLTSQEQAKYSFTSEGETVFDGRKAYRIVFRPSDPKEYAWKGEAVVDAAEFQPLSVWTMFSRKLPFAVRTVLGVDVPGLGFSIRYGRMEKDIWFPTTLGTEFRVDALHLIHRTIMEDIENKNFRRTDVQSAISFGGDKK